MYLELFSFIHGILSNIIDYIYDSQLFLEYKLWYESLFIILTLFFFLHNKYISFFGSGLFVFGGIAGMIFAPHAVDALIWKISILISIPIFLYHIFNIKSLINSVTNKDIIQFIFNVMPIIVFSLLLALLEDYLVPEEYGNKKLYDKMSQFIILLSFLYFLNYSSISFFNDLTYINKLILNTFSLAWLGNIVSGIFILSQLSHLFEKNNKEYLQETKC